MKITKLEYQKKDPNFVNVFVDEKFIAGVHANDLIKLGLFNGKELDAEGLKKLVSDSEFGKLFNFALNFLSYRPRSEWEVRNKLKSRGNATQINEVIKKLKQIGQVSDENFVRWFLDQRRTFKPKGKRAIKYELIKKGIDSKLASKILLEQEENSEESLSDTDLAFQIASKKFSRLFPKITDSQNKQQKYLKIQRFLLSRGFDYDTIKIVVEKLLKVGYND